MNKTTFKLLALIFLLQAFSAVNAQDPQKAMMTPFGRGYLEYLPAGYETSTEKYPAIIFLHGSGERGTGTPTDLAKVTANGPPKHIKNGHKMGFTVNGKTEYFIVLSPQTNDWSWKYDVVPFVKYALETYRIDPDRVYLTGLSMGGEGTWFGASLEDNSPNLFAAIGVMCGRASETDGANVASKNIPVWAFHGDADTAIPLSAGQRPLIGMIKATANPAPIFTVYAGGSHGTAWDRGYRTDHTYHSPNLYEWFLAQRRNNVTTPPPNVTPTVNAGVDQNLALPTSTATLSATATDPDGSIICYTWSKISGPAAIISATNNKLSVSGMTTTGTYTFKVTATDSRNTTATDQVIVTVGGTSNVAPTVTAGSDKSMTLPTSSATIAASATDADGTIASYTWAKVSGPSATLSNANSNTLSVSGMTTTGTYTFSVTATDNLNASATDQVTVTVNPAPANVVPTVNAGVDQVIVLPTSATTLSATATDTDGTIASYVWSKISGPAATLTNANTSTLSVSGMTAAGTYTFSVTATDNANASVTDQVIVTVNPPVNVAPTVNAGSDQVFALPTSTATLSATATDTDGTIASYVWSKISGPAATLVNGNSSTLSVTNMTTAGTYTFAVTVTDNQNATATDQVIVTVNPAPANILPVVEAGEKQYITLPVNTASFSAAASDADGSIASYSWKKIGGSSTIVMTGTSSATLNVSGVVPGTYVFRVEVADNTGAKAADTVRLKVNDYLVTTTTTTTARMATSEVSESVEEEMVTALGQNYPNPFTTQTTIPFTVSMDQQVVIKVYSSTGVEVATVLNDLVSAGEHTVQVDATSFGTSRANAIYYYKLFAAGKVTTKQLVVIQ